MSNTFKFVGQIKRLEDRKDRRYIETVSFDSGWTIERVKFRMVCGTSAEYVDLSAGKWKDNSKNVIYTMFNEGDSTKKGQVKWDERFDPDVIEKIPSYKKYVVDLSSDKIRKQVSESGDLVKLGDLSALKYSYISEYDFVMKVEEFLRSGAFENGTFVVSGNIEYTYSIKDGDEGRYYRSFVPTSIHKASDDEIEGAYGKLEMFYEPNTLIDEDTTEDGNHLVKGYVQFYDRTSKGNYYAPVSAVIKNDNPRKEGLIKVASKCDSDAEVLQLGFTVNFQDGAERVEIKLEDLTDDQRDLIDWGLKTLEEIQREMGNSAYGKNTSAVYINNIASGFAAPQSTEIAADKLYERPDGLKKKKVTNKSTIDLFDDEEEDI